MLQTREEINREIDELARGMNVDSILLAGKKDAVPQDHSDGSRVRKLRQLMLQAATADAEYTMGMFPHHKHHLSTTSATDGG